MAEDFLSRLLSAKVAQGSIIPMHHMRNSYFSSHFLYADDVLLFSKATVSNMKVVNDSFTLYGNLLGQLVNWSKSEAYFGSSISVARISKLHQVVEIKHGSLPFMYLGSIVLGCSKKEMVKTYCRKGL